MFLKMDNDNSGKAKNAKNVLKLANLEGIEIRNESIKTNNNTHHFGAKDKSSIVIPMVMTMVSINIMYFDGNIH